MKLFQQLLLAPAALGLLAPVAATAAEVNINDVANYARKPVSQMRAAKATQFSDVVPGDWAYTALLNLSESYGCVDSAYTQNLKSGQSLTRYEAAALVNSCLQGGVSDAGNSDVLRLTNEFGTEMAILKGRVDGLEYKVQELSAGQFSPTTKISNTVAFNTGYVKDELAQTGNSLDNKLHMQYDFKTDIYTSFNGKDQLYTRFRAGNESGPFGDQPFGTHLARSNGNAAIQVDKLWYTSSFGSDDSFRYWVGPRIEGYYMLASAPSIYKPVLKQFANGGAASTYGSSTGTGFGIAWTQPKDDRTEARFEVSSNYSVGNNGGRTATTGILTDNQSKWLSKIGYGSPRWQVSLAMAKNMCDDPTPGTAGDAETCNAWNSYYTTATALSSSDTGDKTAYALRANWKPESSGLVPSIQAGYEWATIDDDGTNATTSALGSVEATRSWMIGLMWNDAFVDGNRAGVAFGAPEHATDFVDVNFTNNDPANKAFAWEAYYDYKVNDGITITPAIFKYNNRSTGSTLQNDGFGGLIQTTFKF